MIDPHLLLSGWYGVDDGAWLGMVDVDVDVG